LKSLTSKVSTTMVGRSSVLRLTVEDRDKVRALSLLRAIAGKYASIHANDATVDPTSPAAPVVTYSVLTPPRLLDYSGWRRALRALAAGSLIGIAVAAGLAAILLRPAFPRRASPRP
jgi:hypothetical protein